MVDASECRSGCRADLVAIGVVDVGILAVQHIQEFRRNMPLLVELIPQFPIEQYRLTRLIESIRRQGARTKVAET